jgi:tubulin gamma
MLANHTSMAELFDRLLKQFDRIRKRNAFLDNYRKEPMFSDNLDEFEDSRETVQALVDEYRACESMDYVDFDFGWNTRQSTAVGGSGGGGGGPGLGGASTTSTVSSIKSYS